MNLKDLLILVLFIIFILCLCNNKEYFTSRLSDRNYQFEMISSTVDINDGYNSYVCRDDYNWKKNNLSCLDYSYENMNCSDIGDNGVSANNACLVSCNNCPSSLKIKSKKDKINTIDNQELEQIVDPLNNESNFMNIYDKLEEVEVKLNNMIQDTLINNDEQ